MESVSEFKRMKRSVDFGQWPKIDNGQWSKRIESEVPQIENESAYDQKIEKILPQQQNPSSPVRSASYEKSANKTYSELIIEAIESNPQKRLTLSQIYEWMINNVPNCRENAKTPSTSGWKNCIRHNLSLHKEFQRLPIDTKNSFWFINYEELERKRNSKHGASGRKRAQSFTNSLKPQGFDLTSALDRCRAKSLGTSQHPRAGFMRLQSLNEAIAKPLSFGTNEFSTRENPPGSISEYLTMQDGNSSSRAPTVVEFQVPAPQAVGLEDMELEKGERHLSELKPMEAARNVPKVEVERINFRTEAQADKDWNNMVYNMMDEILEEDSNLEPIVDSMLTARNFEEASDQFFASA